MSTQGVLPSQTRQGFVELPQDAELVRVLEGIGTSASSLVRKDVGKSEFSVKTGRQSSSPHWVLGSGGRPEQVCLQWPLEKEATASGTETHTLSSAPVGRPLGFGYEMAMISPPPGIESCQPTRSLPSPPWGAWQQLRLRKTSIVCLCTLWHACRAIGVRCRPWSATSPA